MNNTKTDQAQTQLRDFTTEILRKLKQYGASDAEAYVYNGTARQVVVRGGEIEKAESATGRSVSVKAYIGKKSATTSFSLDYATDISSALEDLVTATKLSPEDPYCGLADPDQLKKAEEIDLDQYDPTPLLEIDDLCQRARALEKAGTGKEVIVDQSECSHSKGAYYYIASNGFEMSRLISGASQTAVAIHQGKELTREFSSDAKIYLEDLEAIEETGKRAYDRAWTSRNPTRAPSGHYPVLFDERISSTLVSHLLSAMSASSIARRSSWLIDYEEPIFPEGWVLRETPHRKRHNTSAIYDGEGMIKSERIIVENARPQFWISNLSSARQLDIETSGHATRGGVNTGASIRSLILEAPMENKETLLKSMGEGLLITGFIGATINAHTGDYSRGARGFWVRNGEIGEAVNEITIASNLKDILPKLRACDDADDDRSFVVPSLLIEEMSIAGA